MGYLQVDKADWVFLNSIRNIFGSHSTASILGLTSCLLSLFILDVFLGKGKEELLLIMIL